MTPDEMIAGVDRLHPWFHSIELAPGVRTKERSLAGEPADHPQGTWDILKSCIPQDLSGRSVLDVGCNAGFYSIQAKRRNAARVLGVDAQRHPIRQATFVRRALGLDIEYRRMSVYELDPRVIGQFDVTLALGLIYHLKHLVLGLEKLYAVTKDLLILETEILPPGSIPGTFAHPHDYLGGTLRPLGYVENPPGRKEAVYNWFVPTTECVTALLKDLGFLEVEVFSIHGGRAVITARKDENLADSRALSHLAASLTMLDGPTTCRPNDQRSFAIRVENIGTARWLADVADHPDPGVVLLVAHLMDEQGDEVAWLYGATPLNRSLAPGDDDILEIELQAPTQPGAYVVEFDLVATQLAYFEDLGSPIVSHQLVVE